MPTPIKVALIDDSAVVRKHLADLLTKAGMDIIFTAQDPLFAWPKMQAQWPDVVVLDVEMPRMDGISFLKQIMSHRLTPVVMCSTLTEVGCETTLQALEAGAVGFVTKPKAGLKDFLDDSGNGLVDAVRAAARANLSALPRRATPMPTPTPGGLKSPTAAPFVMPPVPGSPGAMAQTTDRLIAMGLSTGGVQTMEAILTALPRTTAGIVIVQHMPEAFTASLAQRLNHLCDMEVMEARDGDRIMTGRVLIAPGGKHLRVERQGAQYRTRVTDGPLVKRHRPSVDVMLKSVAQAAGRNAMGLLLTGMGDDGAHGLLEMFQAGAETIAQDEASSVVWGMPAEAIKLGAARHVLPLSAMAARICRFSAGS
ncbi:chemotaxis response regulator protein-glutamate methylesterase [Aquabacterium sp. A3]|uniref:protein-glutamate methylesterase/protein-glutamine glutaminase n=1 Tax=Aquabacterium sp. A3 TaxID=3132829 RepID=UPI00311A663E